MTFCFPGETRNVVTMADGGAEQHLTQVANCGIQFFIFLLGKALHISTTTGTGKSASEEKLPPTVGVS